MKLIVIVFTFAVILSACSNFSSNVTLTKKISPVNPNNRVYCYYEKKNQVPDSAIYIGDIAYYYSGSAAIWLGHFSNNFELVAYMQNEVRKAGGNLLYINEMQDESSKAFVSGKIYLINDFEITQFKHEDSLKKVWATRNPDKYEGIYELDLKIYGNEYSGLYAKSGVIKTDTNKYQMIYLGGYGSLKAPWFFQWMTFIWWYGDVMAFMEKTDKSSLLRTKSYQFNKFLNQSGMMKYENDILRKSSEFGIEYYRKIYPDSAKNESIVGSLTGIMIDKTHILTCYHGVSDENNKIFLKGINGDFDNRFLAKVEKYDKTMDLALLRIVDTNFAINSYRLPFSETQKSTGEEIYVLGYPESVLLGDEIKLITGVISSTSGFGGDLNSYQISSPIQPGNSGSPLFDKNGNLIGIVQARFGSGNSVGYSLKMLHLSEFLKINNINIQTQPENSLKDQNWVEKVKILQNSIYLIEVIKDEPIKLNTKLAKKRFK